MRILNKCRFLLAKISIALLIFCCGSALADTHYVDLNNPSPSAPYTSWATASTNIQEAVDATSAGDTVLVADGIYDTGGAMIPGRASMNRVMIAKDITVQSVNGPDATIIVGKGPLGDDAVRCAYMSDGILSGFTMTNGHTRTSGGVYISDREYYEAGGGVNLHGGSGMVSNCVIIGNSADFYGGGSSKGTLKNCTIMGNSAYYGGGSRGGTLSNCTLIDNSATDGGGCYDSMLINCTLMDNTANSGGGCYGYGSTLTNCLLEGNSASYRGGGSRYGRLNNCILNGNSSSYRGGGIDGGTLNNCSLAGNSAEEGGGCFSGTLNNCALTANSATSHGGGSLVGTLKNCIVWGNSVGGSSDDIVGGTAYNSCSPDLVHGVGGNITNAPMLLDAFHVAVDSPCIGAGSNLFVVGTTDLDGEAWFSPPSIGCDEFHIGGITGTLSVAISSLQTNVVVEGANLDFQANVVGRIWRLIWEIDDGISISNAPNLSHCWSIPGPKEVILTAYNQTWSAGVSATQTVQVVTPLDVAIHVAPSGDDANDGSSFALAKQTIQAGVDAQQFADGMVLVYDGTYVVTNEITVNKRVLVESANGPEVTLIDGGGTNRCFNLGKAYCVISGLTITNGYANEAGGVYCADMAPVLTNCVLAGNAADYGGAMKQGTAMRCTFSENLALNSGGAKYQGMAKHCTFTNNLALFNGGAIYEGSAINCTIIDNAALNDGGGLHLVTAVNCAVLNNAAASGGGISSGESLNCIIISNLADYGGGIYYGTAYNCIAWDNSADTIGNDFYSSTCLNTCASDGVIHGKNGCITLDPLFTDPATGNYMLKAGSPCINAGSNDYVNTAHDLSGNPRIIGTTVDMGAYEFYTDDGDEDGDGMSNGWEFEYFGSIVKASPFDDNDNDQSDNYSEYISSMNPLNPYSVFAITNFGPKSSFVIEWPSVDGHLYNVMWSTNLVSGFIPIATDLEYPVSSYTDTVHSAKFNGFYKVNVRLAE